MSRLEAVACRLDPNQLTTIVTNLLSNARKYTPAGGRIGVAVEVRSALHSESGDDRLLITVADTGPGIAPARHEEIARFVMDLPLGHAAGAPDAAAYFAAGERLARRRDRPGGHGSRR